MHLQHSESPRLLDGASRAGVATRKGEASSSTEGLAIVQTSEAARNYTEESQEETRKPHLAWRQYTPTAAEVETHLPLHLEFRSWCPHCATGKGTATKQKTELTRDDGTGIYAVSRLLLHDA